MSYMLYSTIIFSVCSQNQYAARSTYNQLGTYAAAQLHVSVLRPPGAVYLDHAVL